MIGLKPRQYFHRRSLLGVNIVDVGWMKWLTLEEVASHSLSCDFCWWGSEIPDDDQVDDSTEGDGGYHRVVVHCWHGVRCIVRSSHADYYSVL